MLLISVRSTKCNKYGIYEQWGVHYVSACFFSERSSFALLELGIVFPLFCRLFLNYLYMDALGGLLQVTLSDRYVTISRETRGRQTVTPPPKRARAISTTMQSRHPADHLTSCSVISFNFRILHEPPSQILHSTFHSKHPTTAKGHCRTIK